MRVTGSPFQTPNVTLMGDQTSDNVRITGGSISGVNGFAPSVMDFAAVGDGVTDDLAAFNAMQARAAQLYEGSGIRGTFTIPAGRYHLSDVYQITSPGIYLAHGAVIDNTVWVGDELIDLHGLWVDGAMYNGIVMHRGPQNGGLYGCGAINCGGFGLVAGGYHRSQLALGKVDFFTSKGNAGGYSVSTGIGGLHCVQLPGDAYSPGAITNAGSGYTNGVFVAPATGGTGARAILALTIAGGMVTACQPIHSGAGYTAGDTLSFTNAAAFNASGDPVTAGSGFVYTVGNVLDTRSWNNSMHLERLIIRENWRYAIQMDGANSYNTWITPQIESNRTKSTPVIQGTALALTIVGPHLAAVRGFSPTPNLTPTSITRVTTTATLVHTSHGLAVNDFIQVSANAPFNGLFRILTTADADTATFAVLDSGATTATNPLWIKAVPDTVGTTALMDFESAGCSGRSATIIGGRIGNQFSISATPRTDMLKLNVSASVANTEVFSNETTTFGNTPRVFTPVLSFVTNGDTSVVYTTQVGRWIEDVGRIFVEIEVVATITHTTASGTFQITGLPKVASLVPSRHPLTIGRINNINTASTVTSFVATVIGNNATIFFYENRDTLTAAAIDSTQIASGSTFTFEVAGWYLVNEAASLEPPLEPDE